MNPKNGSVARLAALALALLAMTPATLAQPLSTNQAVAREFARQLALAPDEQAKSGILPDIFHWLNIGVHTGDLKRLVDGAAGRRTRQAARAALGLCPRPETRGKATRRVAALPDTRRHPPSLGLAGAPAPGAQSEASCGRPASLPGGGSPGL